MLEAVAYASVESNCIVSNILSYLGQSFVCIPEPVATIVLYLATVLFTEDIWGQTWTQHFVKSHNAV